jgi:hypothetical protein
MTYFDPEKDQYILEGVRLLGREGACIVCGHPTGDCLGEKSHHVQVVGANVFPSLQHEDVFIVEEDVIEERWISPFTKTTVIIASKGSVIPLAKAKELGLI